MSCLFDGNAVQENMCIVSLSLLMVSLFALVAFLRLELSLLTSLERSSGN